MTVSGKAPSLSLTPPFKFYIQMLSRHFVVLMALPMNIFLLRVIKFRDRAGGKSCHIALYYDCDLPGNLQGNSIAEAQSFAGII